MNKNGRVDRVLEGVGCGEAGRKEIPGKKRPSSIKTNRNQTILSEEAIGGISRHMLRRWCAKLKCKTIMQVLLELDHTRPSRSVLEVTEWSCSMSSLSSRSRTVSL